jgi:hypothetical protein
MLNPLTPQMMALFEGNTNAYGKFNVDGAIRVDGKIKGHGVTIRSQVTNELWNAHLAGEQQLGIIPINEDSMCRFAAIDIDDYSVNKEELNHKIYTNNLPLILFRSKSGGAHLFMFMKEPAPATLVQEKMRMMAAFLGHGTAEIFPKQTQILKERGDLGQWINMPYFNHNNTTRYATRCEDFIRLSLTQFLTYVETKMVSLVQLERLKPVKTELLPYGPPCLQQLAELGFPDGTRNQGLFAMGIYAQKSQPDTWKKVLEEYNFKYMKPPLSPNEVLIVIGSLDKKEYNYPCKKPPICVHCNVSVCRSRKYGVGQSSGMPAMGTLTKMNSEPPIWFIDIEGGGRLELTTDQLSNPVLFQKACLSALNTMPPVMTRHGWQMIVQELLETVQVIEMPKEANPTGQLMLHLEDFCTNRSGEDSPEIILRGMVYNTEVFHVFRLSDFMSYLDRKRFFEFKTNKVAQIIRDVAKGMHKGINVHKGKYINCYHVPLFNQNNEKFVPPSQDKNIVPF